MRTTTRRRNDRAIWLGAAILLLATVLQAAPRPGECPQPRFTGKAPDEYYNMTRPGGAEAADAASGERLYQGDPGAGASAASAAAKCALCHGKSGDGKGILANQYDPPPRNFSCAMAVNGIPDGQLFWIIRFGSPGTAMPPHPGLKDAQIWQIVTYLRQLAR